MPIVKYQKASAASRQILSVQPLGPRPQNSNRQTYEKLEVSLSTAKSVTSIFLIDSKQHFIQGALRREGGLEGPQL